MAISKIKRGSAEFAILSVLAGNWRPSMSTRFRLWVFFALVTLQRIIPIAPRTASATSRMPVTNIASRTKYRL